MAAPPRPTRDDLERAYGCRVPDLMRPGLTLVFCGINPSLYSAAVGHHFARPGNRFWRTIYQAGFSSRLLAPEDERELLDGGIGVTNIVPRATAGADELSKSELEKGALALARKLRRYQPRCVAFLGIGAYRIALGRPDAAIGLQRERIAGVELWALPNPSGLNAHYQLDALVREYGTLAAWLHFTPASTGQDGAKIARKYRR